MDAATLDFVESAFTGIMVFGIVALVLGIVSNILITLLMSFDHQTRLTTKMFVLVLAQVDLVNLFINGWRFAQMYVPSMATKVDAQLLSTLGCRLQSFFGQFVWDITDWLVVVLSIERVLLVHFPTTQWMQKQQKWIIAAVLLGILGFTILKNFALLFRFDLYISAACQQLSDGLSMQTYRMVDMIFMGFATRLLLVLSNAFLVYAICHRRQNVGAVDHTGGGGNSTESPENFALQENGKMITTMALMHLMLSMPIFIVRVADYAHPLVTNPVLAQAVSICLTWIYLTNSCWRFFIYCAASQHFRNGIKKLKC